MSEAKIKLIKVDTDNFDDLIDLSPGEEGKHFVASNIYSLAEAYANNAEGKFAQPFGIYLDDKPIGFLMIGFSNLDEEDMKYVDKYPFLENSYLFWRFMIDEKYQNKGYGKEAMSLAMDYIRSFPNGEAEYCWLSYEPENEKARYLYKSFGFIEEKEMPEGWDEIPAVLKL